MNPSFKKPLLQEYNFLNCNDGYIKTWVLREDLIHPFINGNKWRKLKYNLVDFQNSGKKTFLTFGGAYSNHLVATACAGHEYNINTIGVVRGEEVTNAYLKFAIDKGMKLLFVSRHDYRNKTAKEFTENLLKIVSENEWVENIEDVFILPEGGSNEAAVKGASEIMEVIPDDCNIVVSACGTGATLAGISKKLLSHQHAIGITVLKAEGYFEKEITRLGGDVSKITIIEDYHFGGYAKKNKLLENFCNDFTLKTRIAVEPVYTGKLFFAINELIKKNYFKSGSKVTIIHTGGIFNFN